MKKNLNYLPKQYKKNNKLKINHSYLIEQFSDYKKILKNIEKVIKKGDYTQGKEVNKFEKNLAKRTGAKFVISVVKGTDFALDPQVGHCVAEVSSGLQQPAAIVSSADSRFRS